MKTVPISLRLLFILSFLVNLNIVAQTTYDVVVGPGLTYSPDVLTINEGDAVTFTSEGGSHDVNFDINTLTGQSFGNPAEVTSLPTQGAGLMGTITFDVAGTYNYDCSVYGHASGGMVGQIIVNATASNTIVDIVVNSDDHTTLEAAVIAADLATTLSGDGPFTLFAPTDAAFAMIPEEVLNSLLADPSGTLTEILLTHVASGNVLSSDLSDGMMIPSLSTTSLNVSITDGAVMINGATVIVADLQADNGVVHVIDAVIIPEITGCTDFNAINFDPSANSDNGTCEYDVSSDLSLVNFTVDMNGVDQPSADYDNVVVNGSWNGWNGWGVTLSDDNQDGLWTGSLELAPGTSFEYVVAVTGPADAYSGWGLQWGDGCQGSNVSVTVGSSGSVTETNLIAGCSDIIGCMDLNASNYDMDATEQQLDQYGNINCLYTSCNEIPEPGCIYPDGFGPFNAEFNASDCTTYGGTPCEGIISEVNGCMDENATNYNINATVDNGTCQYLSLIHISEPTRPY